MKKIATTLLFIAAFIAADASTISYTNSISKYTPWSGDVTIPQFNPVLGTLRSVNLQVQILSTMKVQAENKSSGPATLSSWMTNTISIYPTGADSFWIPQASPFNKTFTAFDGFVDFGGSSGISRTSGVLDTYALPVTNMSAYNGYSVVPVTVSTTGNFNYTFTGGANVLGGSDAVEVKVFVSYTFDSPCSLIP